MDYERFEDRSATASNIDPDENGGVLELTLDELSHVAGGASDVLVTTAAGQQITIQVKTNVKAGWGAGWGMGMNRCEAFRR